MATDFSKILTELKEAGYKDGEIAEIAGVNRTMVLRLRTGERGQPTYDIGAAIVDLHKKAMRKRKA